MSATDWLVVLGGIAAIVWINWYFFAAGRTVPPAAAASTGAMTGEVAELTVVVDGGYSPAAIRLQAGVRTRLVFDRRDEGGCSEEVVFPDFGIRKFLPAGQKTAIDITPRSEGRYSFACGMGMLRGSLIVTS